jgi:hypothetical protein
MSCCQRSRKRKLFEKMKRRKENIEKRITKLYFSWAWGVPKARRRREEETEAA